MKKKSLRKKHRIKKKKPITENTFFSGVLFFLFIFLIGVYFFVFYPLFQIESVTVENLETIDKEAVENFVKKRTENKILFLSTRSTFLISGKRISEELLKDLPTIGNVVTRRTFPDGLNVEIIERRPMAFWCKEKNREKCFFIDSEGVAFQRTDKLTTARPILVKGEDPGRYNQVVTKDTLSLLFLIHKTVSKKNAEVSFFRMTSDDYVAAHTNEGFEIYFTLTDTEKELENLKIILGKKLGEKERKDLKYIDLRFGDRVYYK